VRTIGRRHLLRGLLLGSGVLAARTAVAQSQTIDIAAIKKETDVACLYHCDFGDPRRVGQMITNINNHLSVYDNDPFKIKIVVVAHGQGIKPFLDNLEGTPWTKDELPPDIFARYADLAKSGVDVYLCQITFTNNKIDPAKARAEPFIKLVPSGVATVAALQAKGVRLSKGRLITAP
jgi:intracellular sulfur oxidation DsrE/DsrF family protein